MALPLEDGGTDMHDFEESQYNYCGSSRRLWTSNNIWSSWMNWRYVKSAIIASLSPRYNDHCNHCILLRRHICVYKQINHPMHGYGNTLPHQPHCGDSPSANRQPCKWYLGLRNSRDKHATMAGYDDTDCQKHTDYAWGATNIHQMCLLYNSQTMDHILLSVLTQNGYLKNVWT